MKFAHLNFSFLVLRNAPRPGESLIEFLFSRRFLAQWVFSACSDHMQTAKQYYSKCKWKNGRNQAIIEDKYATPGASFIDISLTSQWATAGICTNAVKEFRQKIIQNI